MQVPYSKPTNEFIDEFMLVSTDNTLQSKDYMLKLKDQLEIIDLKSYAMEPCTVSNNIGIVNNRNMYGCCQT